MFIHKTYSTQSVYISRQQCSYNNTYIPSSKHNRLELTLAVSLREAFQSMVNINKDKRKIQNRSEVPNSEMTICLNVLQLLKVKGIAA